MCSGWSPINILGDGDHTQHCYSPWQMREQGHEILGPCSRLQDRSRGARIRTCSLLFASSAAPGVGPNIMDGDEETWLRSSEPSRNSHRLSFHRCWENSRNSLPPPSPWLPPSSNPGTGFQCKWHPLPNAGEILWCLISHASEMSLREF